MGSITLGPRTHLCDFYLVEECGEDDEHDYGVHGLGEPKQVFANWGELPEGWADGVLSFRCFDEELKFGYG